MRTHAPSRTNPLTIAAALLPHLRAGVKDELSTALELLLLQIHSGPAPKRWHSTLKRFYEGCALLEELGFTDDPLQHDLELDPRHARLILRSLEAEHQAGLHRMHDAKAAGFDPTEIGKDIPALGETVSEIQKRTGLKPRRKTQKSYLQAQLDTRRKGRRRGDAK